jgi:hypothetical protein
VDLIVDVPTRVAYYAPNKLLRDQDFREASEEGAPLCRWIVEEVRVDVMPVEELIAGNEAQGIDEHQAREMVDRRSFSSSDDDLLLEPFG